MRMRMPSSLFWSLAVVLAVGGCDAERKQDCDALISAMGPMKVDEPSAEVVDRVRDDVAALQVRDEPLREYTTNYKRTLTALSNTLKLKTTAGPDGPPDGTDALIKANVKAAHTDFADVSRYCSP